MNTWELVKRSSLNFRLAAYPVSGGHKLCHKCFQTSTFTIRFYFLAPPLLFPLSFAFHVLSIIPLLPYPFHVKTLLDALKMAENKQREPSWRMHMTWYGSSVPNILLAWADVLQTDAVVEAFCLNSFNILSCNGGWKDRIWRNRAVSRHSWRRKIRVIRQRNLHTILSGFWEIGMRVAWRRCDLSECLRFSSVNWWSPSTLRRKSAWNIYSRQFSS